MTRKARSSISRLRLWLLFGLILVAGLIVGLFYFGRAGRDSQGNGADGDADQTPSAIASGQEGENLALIGKDFDYTFTEGEKPLFRIRGESIKADRQETIYLDRVGLTLYDREGRAYEIESERASFNRLQNEGRLEGKVRLKGPEGLTLASPLLLLQDRGQTLVCPRPVDLGYGGKYHVQAKFLRVHLPQELYVLAGDVVLRSVAGVVPALGLNADRVVYERKERRLRVEGQVLLTRGPDRVRTQIVNAFLTPDERGAVYLRAVLDVEGSHFGGGGGKGGARVDFSGKTLGLLTPPNDGLAREIELEGTPIAPAMIRSTGSGLVRRLTARRIEGRMVQGALKTARAIAGVDLIETPVAGRANQEGAAATRTAHSRAALATFGPDGRIAEAVMNEEVRFTDGKTKANGNRALLQLDAGTGEFFGTPVEVENDRGRVTAPHAVWERAANLLRFDGGVRALLTRADDTELTGSALGDGKGPLWVEAREGFYRGSPKSFLFRNNVRAWRGKDLLIADELRGDAATPAGSATAGGAGDRLNAKGNVRTLWVPEKQAGDAESREPIEVFAPELAYSRDSGRIEYHGGVRVLQAGRTLNCKDLVVDVDRDKKAERMNCSGDARLNDPKTGKRISGEVANYRVGDRVIEISGNPVQMRDKDGNQIQGRQVVYWVDGGKVEVRGRAGTVPAAPPANPSGTGGEGRR